MKLLSLVSLFTLAALQSSLGQSATIPTGAITIGKSGSGGTYTTITAALADTSSSIYYIYAGNYTEAVVITRAGITIYGATSSTYDYSANTVTISRSESAAAAGSDDASGTVRVTKTATGVSFYNLNIENTYGVGSQAIALSAYATNFACYACQLRGYQDTLLAEAGYQFYAKSLITGAVDFIFGQTGSVWITESTIKTVGNGCITASGRSSADATYYVINDSTITSTSYTNYLGRPWSDYARVIFQNSYLGSNIQAAGWEEWSTATPNIDHITFGEYANTGPGDWNSARASFATQLTAPISITWINSAWLTTTGGVSTTTTKATTTTTTKTSTTTTKTSTTATATDAAGEYSQCGGIGYTGPTTCVSPYVCTYSNDYYSQCL
ncbi:hypothetical protein FRB94_014302 [Tulasnella sp. JGI-2019a]|nr:hypothetical protein FRB93_000706 [Tulasnella sp. JGI-2019a]KAG9007533.1 hypothetical protein FRB94_014302 [Tulasnella sp. JGI-2019a]